MRIKQLGINDQMNCVKLYNDTKERDANLKAIDKKIERFARYLQRQNNLDHIQFLKIRLGIQVALGNFFKTIVTYGVALLFHTFLYTLITHLTYFFVRRFAHGAHARSSLLCHIQNLVLFVALPWSIVHFQVSWTFMILLAFIAFIIIICYAPAATKKQPILPHLRKKKKRNAILISICFLVLMLFVSEPYMQLIALGMCLEAITLLPIFFSKEET
ncbi:histidine kinase [Staphylococcus lugdunensis]|jgi:accessory gene regulator B|uniref:Accessory gene regulator protein B n=2 Tax=Staphylococcus lugdunensis TaxID=28035 RepID=A0A133Q477_STALU|nr:histidine kinase [Staphylococcus lugdunensis]EFU83102.1 accessory protein regulator protein B [Staphylococcus lugdunensis M23590]EHS04768.1 accessory protein regulator protein B [Staphylococcus lugdunensis VCU139]KAK57616.1 accessory protein regulator protein B [Staphylococcus lugdunensis VCU150]KAK62051.1 accessory protein regulator protein B [Staphylococcus lugdunensis VCU148]